MNLIEIGKISSSHGLKGAFKIERYIDDVDLFYNFDEIYIFGYVDSFEVEDVIIKKQSVILKLEGIDDINTIQNMVGCSIYVNKIEIADLENDQYFHNDLIGLNAVYNSSIIGKVKDIINGTNQDLIVITNGKKECLIPFVKEFVKEVSIEKSSIIIDVIEGLIPWI